MDIMKRYVFLLTVFMAIHINAQVLSDGRQWVGCSLILKSISWKNVLSKPNWV